MATTRKPYESEGERIWDLALSDPPQDYKDMLCHDPELGQVPYRPISRGGWATLAAAVILSWSALWLVAKAVDYFLLN